MSVSETDLIPTLADLARLTAKVQHVGHIEFQEEQPFPVAEWAEAVRWCIEKSREPHVRFAALACGGTFQRSWWDGELRWDIRRNSGLDHCLHENRHDDPEGE